MTRTLTRTILALAILAALMGAASTCPGEAGTAPATPQAHPNGKGGTRLIELNAIGEGAKRAHIFAQVGNQKPMVNDERNLPWGPVFVSIPDTAFVDFAVTLIDPLSGKGTVTCQIKDANGDVISEDGPGVDVQCFLVPLRQPA